MTITAVVAPTAPTSSRAQSNEIAPMGLRLRARASTRSLAENAPRWAERGRGRSCRRSRSSRAATTCCCTRRNLWLTVHEVDRASHGARSRARLRGQLRRHQLRRAAGAGARQAASSARDIMNVVGDREQPGSLGAIGWDDEGVKPEKFDIIKNGVVRRLPDDARAGARCSTDYYKQHRQAGEELRLLVRAELGRRAVPAHAERVASCRARTTTRGRT